MRKIYKGTKMEITLNRKQIDKLVEIVSHFKEIEKFTISTDDIDGIGDMVKVTFNLFDEESE